MSWISPARRSTRRALAIPASLAIVVGALATTTALVTPQRVAAQLADCPLLTENPQVYVSMEYCFTIPANVTFIRAVLVGGTGGNGIVGSGTQSGLGGLGGHGMQVSGDVAVVPGQEIWVYVGGNGQNGGTDSGAGAGERGFGAAHGRPRRSASPRARGQNARPAGVAGEGHHLSPAHLPG